MRRLDKAEPDEAVWKRKALVREKVVHSFLYAKQHFGYRGLAAGDLRRTQRIALLGHRFKQMAGRMTKQILEGRGSNMKSPAFG